MKVTIQKVIDVKSPTRAHATDAGLDLYVPEGHGRLIPPGAVRMIDLGIRVAIPDGYYGQLTLRSSAGEKGLAIPHGVGVIDSGYRGRLKVLLVALTKLVVVDAGESICQLVIHPQPSVEVEAGIVDTDTDRGVGGFGSTSTDATIRDYATQEGGPLTIGRLLGQLQDAASRYGDDTLVGMPAGDSGSYEQAGDLLVVNAVKTGCAGGWDQHRADTSGNPLAVIS